MSYILFSVILFYLVICCCAEDKFKNVNYKYHVSTDTQNWIQAFINCKNAGMELASIPTQQDQENLEKYLTQNEYDKGYWLSGTNLGNGNWYWASTGNAIVYTKWLKNQPDNAKLDENNRKGEHCLQWGLYSTSPKPIGWNDLGCNLKLPYICQETEYCN